jgi:uncharacterized protein
MRTENPCKTAVWANCRIGGYGFDIEIREMHVSEIWRYPIKSLKGERLQQADINVNGIPGDREIVVVRALNGRILTSRVKPGMLGLQGSIGPDGMPTINGLRWDSPEALELVTKAAGEDVSLERLPAPQAFDVLPLLVATDGAAQYLNIDHRRLRPNILLADVPDLEERKWPGRILASLGLEVQIIRGG